MDKTDRTVRKRYMQENVSLLESFKNQPIVGLTSISLLIEKSATRFFIFIKNVNFSLHVVGHAGASISRNIRGSVNATIK